MVHLKVSMLEFITPQKRGLLIHNVISLIHDYNEKMITLFFFFYPKQFQLIVCALSLRSFDYYKLVSLVVVYDRLL
jgi:hypothetical protein